MYFPDFKGCIAVKKKKKDCSIAWLYPLSHYIYMTDDYLAKISLCKYFLKAPINIRV